MNEIIIGFADYGALGLIIILLITALVYQTKREERKDSKLLEVHTNSIQMMADLSNVINSINESTSNIPKDVRSELVDDFKALNKSIESIK